MTGRVQPLRRKITLPFLVVAIALPLIALLVFNIGMWLYLLQTARGDLRTSSGVILALVRQQSNEDALVESSGSLGSRLRERIGDVRTVLQTSRLAMTCDLMVLDRNGQRILPASASLDAAVQQRIFSRLSSETDSARLAQDGLAARTHTIWTRQGQFLFMGVPLLQAAPERGPQLVFFTRVSLTNGYMRFINLLLIGIFLAGSVVSLAIARRTAAGIEQPLQTLNAFAERIGHGVFAPMPDQGTDGQKDPPTGSGPGHGVSKRPPANHDAILELAELTGRMNRMAERLSHADRLQRTFLQNASHALRTPLMAIQGYAEGLASGIIPDTAGAAAIIRDESLRLKSLVEKLLALSRIENRSGQIMLEVDSLPDRIREIVSFLEAAARQAGRVLKLDVGRGPLSVLLDEDLLHQAISNLLGNAFRHACREVRVTVFRDGPDAVVRIEDDGPGIAPQDMPHLFERFYKGQGGQSGLGLAIAASAAAALNGRLAAGNRAPGPGAVFELRLPLAETPSEHA